MWDVASGEPIGEPLRHKGIVRAAAFRPDGEILMTAASDGALYRWDAATGNTAGPALQHKSPVLALAWSPSGKTVLVGDMMNSEVKGL